MPQPPSKTIETVDWQSPVGCTDLNAPLEPFLAWCKQHQVLLHKCTIGKLKHTGRCVLATADIAKGEVVVEVPDDAVLMAENTVIVKKLDKAGLVKPADQPILEVAGLMIALMYERSKGGKSRWAPYLSFLPTDLSHLPMFWTARELRELRGTACLDQMEGVVQRPAAPPVQVEQVWEQVVRPFIQEHPGLGLSEGPEGYALYRWSTALVSSYAFQLGDDKFQALVPCWDLLNHVTGRANVRLHHCEEREVLQMIASRPIPQGAELVNDFGPLSNSELLRSYGFVEGHTDVHECAQIPLRVLTHVAAEALALQQQQGEAGAACSRSGAEASRSKRKRGNTPDADADADTEAPPPHPPLELRREKLALLRVGRLLPRARAIRVPLHGGPPPELSEALRLLLLPAAAFKAFVGHVEGWQVPMARPLARLGCTTDPDPDLQTQLDSDLDLEQQSPAALPLAYRLLVQHMSARYPTSLAHDQRMAAHMALLPPRLAAALQARLGEKRALVNLQGWLEGLGAAGHGPEGGPQGEAQAQQSAAPTSGDGAVLPALLRHAARAWEQPRPGMAAYKRGGKGGQGHQHQHQHCGDEQCTDPGCSHHQQGQGQGQGHDHACSEHCHHHSHDHDDCCHDGDCHDQHHHHGHHHGHSACCHGGHGEQQQQQQGRCGKGARRGQEGPG